MGLRLRGALGHLLLLFGVLLGLGGVGLAGVHGWAWYHFLAGRAALERYHAENARDHLEACLKVWPDSAETHFLASRAARRADDYESADRHLLEGQLPHG